MLSVIPGTYDYIMVFRKMDFEDVIKVKYLQMWRLFGITQVGSTQSHESLKKRTFPN